MKADLFLMDVTLGVGGGLGVIFGKAALKAVVVDRAVNFICKHNMNRAFVENTQGFQGAHDFSYQRTLGPVNQLTSSRNYPQGSHTSSNGFGFHSDTWIYVDYDEPGSRIMSRIEQLYRERIGGSFLQGGYGRDELARAEAIARQLQVKCIH